MPQQGPCAASRAAGVLQACNLTVCHMAIENGKAMRPQHTSECYLSWAEPGPGQTGRRDAPPTTAETRTDTVPRTFTARGTSLPQEAPALHQAAQQQSRFPLNMRCSMLVEASYHGASSSDGALVPNSLGVSVELHWRIPRASQSILHVPTFHGAQLCFACDA